MLIYFLTCTTVVLSLIANFRTDSQMRKFDEKPDVFDLVNDMA